VVKKEIKMSIDKISITGKMDDSLFTPLNEFLSNPAIESNYRYFHKNLYSHHFTLADGSYFECSTGTKELDIRLEWNPNKCDWKIIDQILKRFKYPKITRIDWACDYFGYDLSNFLFASITPKKEVEYRNSRGVTETLYLGSPKSDRFTRVYNKAVEKKAKWAENPDEDVIVYENHWRIEAVVKDFNFYKDETMITINEDGEFGLFPVKKAFTDYFFNPFNFMIYIKKQVFMLGNKELENLKVQEKAMIHYLSCFPEELNNLSVNSRRKYKDALFQVYYDIFEYDLHPAGIFEKEKDRLTQEVMSWLRPAIDNGLFKTGIAFG
jgi:hypothetical protein